MNIDELLNKFKNGHDRFHTDAMFNNVVQGLSRGYDPINLLDDVLNAHSELLKQYEALLKESPMPPIIISKEK